MKVLRSICIFLTGAVFIFSGTVKGIDPLGSAYKFHDYFQAFSLGSLQFLTLPLAIILCLVEFLTGFTIITGLRRKEGSFAALVLMIIFTPLTLVLALKNPVSDCGCFGDAIHLSNWATFGKNVVLLCMVLIVFRARSLNDFKLSSAVQWIITGSAALIFIAFELYNLMFLPVIDFLPYSVGTYIPGKMTIPEGAPVNRYETTFIYEKNGIKKEFTLKDYPASDSSWKFVEQKTRLTEKGYIPPIHDFSITAGGEHNITDSILGCPDPIVLMISKKLAEAGNEKLGSGFKQGMKLTSAGIGFLVLTASGSDEIQSRKNGLKFCSVDETTLKTMIRSNPGYMLIRKGKIEGKWSWADVPEDLVQRIRKMN